MSSHETTDPDTSVLELEPAEEQDEWLDESEELPRRPRRRILAPIPLALLAVLLIACGFIGGVEVQKGQTSSASGTAAGAGAGAASRLAALGIRPPGTGATGSGSSASASGSKGAAGAFPGAGGSGGGGVTTGQVAYVRGNTLYVTNSQGNTVKVSAAAGSKVTKTVGTKASSIHPGETVVVLGSAEKNGSISATSISVNPASGGASGAGASSSGTGGGGAPALFGSG
jgi:hypothetical protein